MLSEEGRKRMKAAAYAVLRGMVGDEDLGGLEVARLVRLVANLHEAAASEHLRSAELSPQRWALLLRLYMHESLDGCGGTSPTRLSHWQQVSKNTISALLRGLEEQGLIERAIDPDDKRAFRIRLSDAGRALVRATTPEHVRGLNDLVSGLSESEREQLTALLEKLAHSLAARVHPPEPERRAHDEPRAEPA